MISCFLLQEENEIPASVFVKHPPPFPRDEIPEEGEEPSPGVSDEKQEGGFQTIDLSSDEDVGLEADLEEEELWPQDLENLEKSRAEKLKRSSLKKVRSSEAQVLVLSHRCKHRYITQDPTWYQFACVSMTAILERHCHQPLIAGSCVSVNVVIPNYLNKIFR